MQKVKIIHYLCNQQTNISTAKVIIYSKMKKIITEKGRGAGKISLLRTIRTVLPGECGCFEPGEVDAFLLRSECSKETARTGSRYTVSSRRELGGKVIICRRPDTTENL